MSSGATWAEGDFNGDEVVDDIDATMLAANWAGTLGRAEAASVPEPATLLYLLALLLGFAAHCRVARQ